MLAELQIKASSTAIEISPMGEPWCNRKVAYLVTMKVRG